MHKWGGVLQISFAFPRWNRRIAAMSRITLGLVVLTLASATFAQSGTPVAPPGNSSQPDTNSQGTPNASAPTVPSSVPPDSTNLIAIKTVKTVYPTEALGEKLQGQVIVKMVVSQAGDVESAEVVSGNPVLGRAAVDAAKQWKFKPFIRNGKPVKASVKLPFDFAFSDEITDTSPKTESASGASAAPTRVQIPQGLTQGMVVHKVQPTYPPQALMAGIKGTVLLAAVISKDGTVKELRVVSGPHALVEAAKGAVQQWRYRPYILNGEAVEVETRVEVHFQ